MATLTDTPEPARGFQHLCEEPNICQTILPNMGIFSAQLSFLSELVNVEVRWRSTTGIIFQHKEVQSKAESVHAQLICVPTIDLVHATQLLYRFHSAGASGDFSHFEMILKIASVSLQHYLESRQRSGPMASEEISCDGSTRSALRSWIEDSTVLTIINAVFDEKRTDISATKKLALDLGFVLLSHALDFGDVALGFQAPLSHAQSQLLLLTGKLLESFMVTTPTHYPFMPAEFFGTIQWPVVAQESCSGKVHSIVDFLMPAFLHEESAELSPPQPQVKFCNYEVVARRQPWKGLFSTMQLLRTVRQVLDSRAQASLPQSRSGPGPEKDSCLGTAPASLSDCNAVLVGLKLVFQRMASTDPSLLYRDKALSVMYRVQQQCNVCEQPVQSRMERFNPFSGSRSGRDKDSSGRASSVASTSTTSSFSPSIRAVFGSHKAAKDVTIVFPASASVPAVTIAAMGSRQRHHCRLCFETICSHCSAAHAWMGERMCVECHQVLQVLDLTELREKPRRTFFHLVTQRKGAASNPPPAEMDPKDQEAIAILQGDPPTAPQTDEEKSWWEEDTQICCSMLLPDRLRDWRDRDDEEGY